MVLAVLDSRNLLFSGAAHAVYELDDFSAYVWSSLNSGLSSEQIAAEITEAGGESHIAQSAVAAAVRELLDIDGLNANPTMPAAAAEGATCIMLALAGVVVQLNLSEPLLTEVDAAFGGLSCDAAEPHLQLSASMDGDFVEIRAAGQPASRCRRSEFLPLLKALLIDNVLRWASYEVALHAAALVRDRSALLLLGSPGAGKTTLATALVQRGFEVASDDVVLLDGSGLVSGLRLPFTIKEGAWCMLAADWPALESQPVYSRPDGVRVRYLQHEDFENEGSWPVRFVILLDREAGAQASLCRVGAVEALQVLVAEGESRDHLLSESGFRALVTALRDARCFRLTYSDLSEAAEIVRSIYP